MLFNCLLLGVSWTAYEELDAARTRHGRNFRFSRYDEATRILIVKIAGVPHEALHANLYESYMDEIKSMNLRDSWDTRASGRHLSALNTIPGGRKGKEGDSSGGPDPERVGPGKWPTLVIEAGDSETLAGLRDDMDWWFRHSNHQVKIVILVKLERREGTITIEKWTEQDQGHPNLRSRPSLVPQLRHTINVALLVDGGAYNINVTSAPLILEFDLLFLRASYQGEHNVAIPDAEVRRMASKAFRWAGMIPT